MCPLPLRVMPRADSEPAGAMCTHSDARRTEKPHRGAGPIVGLQVRRKPITQLQAEPLVAVSEFRRIAGAHSPQKEPRRMSGAKFGRSIMGLAGEVANPSLKHRPASDGFYVESPTQHRLHSARIKKAPPAGGLRGSSSCTDRIPDRLHSAGKTCSQGKQSVKARCGCRIVGVPCVRL